MSGQAAPAIIRSVKAMSVAMVGGSIASVLLFGWEVPFVCGIGPASVYRVLGEQEKVAA